jgi:cell division transport system ATP-binding protein
VLSLAKVYKHYPPHQTALSGIDLKLGQGEFIFIAGASGAGKSTLLRLLFAAEKASSGEVIVLGRNLSVLDAGGVSDLRREIGVIFQDYKLLHRRSVIDNVSLPLEVAGISAKERRQLGYELLTSLGLSERCDVSPLSLSGGEQQRVAIARALINRPRLILADEPTGNLDRDLTWQIFELLTAANQAGCTVVVATHDLSIIEELGLRTIVLDQGKIVDDVAKKKDG